MSVPVTPHDLLVTLAQQWTSGRPVTCRCCLGIWSEHRKGCPVPSALRALWELEEQAMRAAARKRAMAEQLENAAARSVVVHTEQQEEHHG